jgi:hypothetical protein
MITQRPTRLTANSFTGVFTGAALSLALAAVLLTSSIAYAADEKEEEPAWDTKIIRGLLEGIGLQRDEKVINYQERAPLVIPPGKTLPPPERSEAVIANNPAWPKDPDVIRAKEEAQRSRDTFMSAQETVDRDARVLRPDQMTPGRRPGQSARGPKTQASASTWTETNQRLTPSQLGYTGGLFGNMFGGKSDETAQFTGEPPRTALTEPPPGYQTPSPDQPYGMSERSQAPKAANSYLERGTQTNK